MYSKTAVIVFKCLHEQAPLYLTELCRPISSDAGHRHLRCAFTRRLLVPRTKTSYGDHNFSVHGPSVWNSLPNDLQLSDMSLETFRSRLKAFLFGHWSARRPICCCAWIWATQIALLLLLLLLHRSLKLLNDSIFIPPVAVYLFHGFSWTCTAIAPSLLQHGTCSVTTCIIWTYKSTAFVAPWSRLFLNSTRHIKHISGVITMMCCINSHWHWHYDGIYCHK